MLKSPWFRTGRSPTDWLEAAQLVRKPPVGTHRSDATAIAGQAPGSGVRDTEGEAAHSGVKSQADLAAAAHRPDFAMALLPPPVCCCSKDPNV